MMTNYNSNALSIEQFEYENLLLDSVDEMSFDIELAGRKTTRGKSLVKVIDSPAIRACSLEKSKKWGFQRYFQLLILINSAID